MLRFFRPQLLTTVRSMQSSVGIKCGIRNLSRHTIVPATIYRIQRDAHSDLEAQSEAEGKATGQFRVDVDDNNYVKGPNSAAPVFNGPLFLPNTIGMQDEYSNYFEQYLEEDETCKPVMITIAKGSTVPQNLILLQDKQVFTFAPSQPKRLSDFNEDLTKFYTTTHTSIEDAGQWFGRHPFHEAPADKDVDAWSA